SDHIDERMRVLEAHGRAAAEAPLLGHGLGTFDRLNIYIMDSENYRVLWDIRAAHNVYVEWLSGAGWLGAGAMFGCIGVLLFAIVAGATLSRTFGPWLRGAACASAVILIHG